LLRRQLTEDRLLARIQRNVGTSEKKMAERLLELADVVGAYPVPRHTSISVRFRLLDRPEAQWLTLFVVTEAGTFYCGWLNEWPKGTLRNIANEYQLKLERALERPVLSAPVHFRKAVPLTTVSEQWPQVRDTIKHVVHKLRRHVKDPSDRGHVAIFSAIEGLTVESRMTRRGRSRPLREAAMRFAKGICTVCRRDFKRVLGGRGVCVLQVHHKKQLGAHDKPKITRVGDLAVVCANCHVLLHAAEPKRTLSPSDLRARLDRS
jgi:hypothetical protein